MEQHSGLEVKPLDELEVKPLGGLEVNTHCGPEVTPHSGIEVARIRNPQWNNGRGPSSYNELPDPESTRSLGPKPKPGASVGRLWNLSTKRFWLIMGALAFILVATVAIVGGVLGTRLAAAQKTKDNITSSSASTSPSSASTRIGSTTTSTDIPTTAPSFPRLVGWISNPVSPSKFALCELRFRFIRLATFLYSSALRYNKLLSSTTTSFASSVMYSATAYPVEQNPVMATLVAGGTTTYIGCPNSNNTVWEDKGTGLRFLRRCGANFVSNDITSTTAYSLEDCMTLCARSHADVNCTAVVWMWGWNGFVNAKVAQFNLCYLKNADYDVPSNLKWEWQAEFGVIIS